MANIRIDAPLIRAVMRLKRMDLHSLAAVSGTRAPNLAAWFDEGTVSPQLLSTASRIAVLQALGLGPMKFRGDTVHLWYMDNRSHDDMQALLTVAKAIGGECEVVSFLPKRDSFISGLSLEKLMLYGLRFEEFNATLVIEMSLFDAVRLVPESLPGFKWFNEYGTPPYVRIGMDKWWDLLEGNVTPGEFDCLSIGKCDAQNWERVRLIARDNGISPRDIEGWIVRYVRDVENLGVEAAQPSPLNGQVVSPPQRATLNAQLLAAARAMDAQDAARDLETPTSSEVSPETDAQAVLSLGDDLPVLTDEVKPMADPVVFEPPLTTKKPHYSVRSNLMSQAPA